MYILYFTLVPFTQTRYFYYDPIDLQWLRFLRIISAYFPHITETFTDCVHDFFTFNSVISRRYNPWLTLSHYYTFLPQFFKLVVSVYTLWL
jgi:hypothetical protein